MLDLFPITTEDTFALISRLTKAWCDELTNNERSAWKRRAGYGKSAFMEFVKSGLKHREIPKCK